MTNLLGNNEDLIEQFMLENDPSANINQLKADVESQEKALELIKESNDNPTDSKIKLNKIENLEEIFRAEDEEEDDDEETVEEESLADKKTDQKLTKASADKKEKAENKSDGDATEYSYENIINYLAQEGIVDLDEDEEFEDNESGLTNVIQKTINKQIDGYKKSLPSIAHEFIEYVEKGGDPAKFLGAVAGPINFADMDLTSEGDQELIVKEYLKSQDYDAAEIRETIEGYKDGLLLEKQATIAQKKLLRIVEAERKIMIAQQEAEVKTKKDNYNTYISTLTKTIKDSRSIAGLEIKDREKDEFQSWLLKPGKDGLTGYQREVQENPIQTQVELAFLKFKKYDFSKVAKAAETAATKKLKLSLTKTTDKNPRGSTGSNLGDSEESTNKGSGLSAFKSFLS